MDEPRSLDRVFKEKLFRIPDYQRRYAWGLDQWSVAGQVKSSQ